MSTFGQAFRLHNASSRFPLNHDPGPELRLQGRRPACGKNCPQRRLQTRAWRRHFQCAAMQRSDLTTNLPRRGATACKRIFAQVANSGSVGEARVEARSRSVEVVSAQPGQEARARPRLVPKDKTRRRMHDACRAFQVAAPTKGSWPLVLTLRPLAELPKQLLLLRR